MPGRRRLSTLLAGVVLLAAVGGGGALVQLNRPLPPPAEHFLPAALTAIPGPAPDLGLPQGGQGEAALAMAELGVFASSPAERPVSIASVAKVATALQVLDDHPLSPGEAGPSVTVSAADVASYQAAVRNEESAVRVAAGERITEYQLLQGLLIPSANNFALMLAAWDSGTVAAFVQKLNDRATRSGLRQTTFADPAGVNPATQSVPSDMARLALEASRNPVLMEIAGQSSAALPVAGTVYNVDRVLGEQGIAGIKTGSGPEFGGSFMFAAPVHPAGGKTVMLVGAVLGLPTLDDAFLLAEKLIGNAARALGYLQVVAAGQVVGSLQAPWGASAPVVATQAAYAVSWPGMAVRTRVHGVTPGSRRLPLAGGSDAGRLEVDVGAQALAVPLVTGAPLVGPGRAWRLLRRA